MKASIVALLTGKAQGIYLNTEAGTAVESELIENLRQALQSAQESEMRGDADAAVAKTAAIKNIQKALTARILKRLDDGQPLVEVARKMKAIEGMQPQINDMERRLGIM
jgi:predicted transcriptional regulator